MGAHRAKESLRWVDEHFEEEEGVAVFVNGLQEVYVFTRFDDLVWPSNRERYGPAEERCLRELTSLVKWFLTKMDMTECYQSKGAVSMEKANNMLNTGN